MNAVAVFAIDPGGVTGWSFMVVPAAALSEPDERILADLSWDHGQIDSRTEGEPWACNELNAEMLDAYGSLHPADEMFVLIEDFKLRKFLQADEVFSPIRITAVLEYIMWCRGWNYSHGQSSEEAMTTATDARLKEWGLYVRKGGLGHARDADRHAITWLRKAKTTLKIRMESWPETFGTC